MAEVVAGLEALLTPVDSLELLEGNPRRGDVEAVRRSLGRFGQRKPIVVRASDRVVVAGNHTLRAARELGWSEIAAVFVEESVAESKAYALADNRTSSLGAIDVGDLAAMVADLAEFDESLLHDASYSADDVAKILEIPTFAADADQPRLDERQQIQCPECGHQFNP
jgi:ParB-like chromosome segregation protein Spo0J